MNSIHKKIRKDGDNELHYDPISKKLSILNALNFNVSDLESPVRIAAEITSRCNLNCIYCSQKKTIIKKDWPLDKAKKLIDEANNSKVFEISFRGGEATLHPNFYDIWNYSVNKDFISTSLTTNGMILSKDVVNSMLDSPYSSISVSLDGFEEVNAKYRNHNQYKKVLNWLLPILPHKRNQMTVLSTICMDSYSQIFDFASFLADEGLKNFSYILQKPLGKNKKNHQHFISIEEVNFLKEQLDLIKTKHPDFNPVMNCYFSNNQSDMQNNISLPVFTEYFCGAGLKITAEQNIGISQSIYFDQEFQNLIYPDETITPRYFGSIRNMENLSELWRQNKDLRLSQAKIAKKYYDFFVGKKLFY